jgi:hypothetical protein
MSRYPMPLGLCGRVRSMMAMSALAISGIAVSVGIASAETWTVVEGNKGAIHGVWQVSIDGSTIAGSAAMLGPKGQALSYRVAGEIRDEKLIVHRVGPSDRNSCTYVVEMSRSDKLAGSALCDGTSYPWHVTRTGMR